MRIGDIGFTVFRLTFNVFYFNGRLLRLDSCYVYDTILINAVLHDKLVPTEIMNLIFYVVIISSYKK